MDLTGYQMHLPDDLHKDARALYQKAVRDEVGTRYWIDVYHYPQIGNAPETYEVEVQFITDKGTMNATWFNFDSLQEIEKEIHDNWEELGSPYYERRNSAKMD